MTGSETNALEAHLSIHDVAPETLEPVGAMLEALRGAGMERAMLLVIPGKPWTESDIDQLRAWSNAGHVLAAHGRAHRVERRRTLYHKLHGALISRHVAEHLSLDADGIATLMREGAEWFERRGLPPPTHYVPPAWALGPISRNRLAELPYATVEVLSGVIDTASGRLRRMPLVGFEADTPSREGFLRIFNAWNLRRARGSGACLRISLHPHDLTLRLGDRILETCRLFRTRPDLPLLS